MDQQRREALQREKESLLHADKLTRREQDRLAEIKAKLSGPRQRQEQTREKVEPGQLDNAISHIHEIGEKRRTQRQNNALHKYCAIMAEKMNDAGYDQKELVGNFKDGFTLPITKHMIKEIIRTVATAMYGIESTAQLTTTQMQEVYRVVDARFGEITQCRSEWPSNEPPMMDEHGE